LSNFDKFKEKKANIFGGEQRESENVNKKIVENIKNKDKRVGLLSMIAKEKRKSEEKFTLAPKSP
jgi:galactokinase/mevalonate kinase-like predicted kinase